MQPSLGDVVDLVALLILYVLVFYRRWRAEGKDVWLVKTGLYFYLVVLAYFTLMPVVTALPTMFNHAYVPMNLQPFIDVALARGDFMRQVVLNVIMLMPFGFLLPLAQKQPRFWKVILATLLLSLMIELLQPLLSSSRSSDITDVVTNTVGGGLGYLVYLAFRPLMTSFLHKIQSKSASSSDIP